MSRTVEDTMEYVNKDRDTFTELTKKNWGKVRGLDGGDILLRWGLSPHFLKHQLVEFRLYTYSNGEREEHTVVVPAQELQHYLRMT